MREFKIAYGNNRMSKTWKNNTITWDNLIARLRTTQRTTETVDEYAKLTKSQQDAIKDIGGFVGGHLAGGRRKKDTVLSRSLIALDMDFGEENVVENVIRKLPYLCAYYSTHKHRPEKPRLRLVIPLSRDISADKYEAVSRMIAKEIGIDMFDDSTYEAHRLMYWPSTSTNGEYIFGNVEGSLLNPDDYLGKYDDWKDVSTWPVSSRKSEIVKVTTKKQADPLSKEGIVGAYCRAHTITDVLINELADVYRPSANGSGRYDFIKGESTAGLVIYEDKFAYSHHATDPASGKLLNAFDLVRVHKFNDDDDKKSFRAMRKYAANDEAVQSLLLAEKQAEAKREFVDWRKGITRSENGEVENTLRNLLIILANDENLKPIVFNQLADGMEIKGKVPWKHPARFWRDADDAQLICYVDSHYGTFSARNYQVAVAKVVDDRSYHPIIDFFDNLPAWDGVSRVETLLIDYLGAADNSYVRAVTRKSICAAVARVQQPGKKFDSILVLNGPQGVGKSTLISRLGGDWYSDSLSLTDMNDKTAAEKLQGYWLIEIGELAGMKKADIDRVKAFISRQDDKYRASFGRRVTPHPRQSVFFGTTNTEHGYLRDITGNRRFWTVTTPGGTTKHPWEITDEEIRQIWAEALELVAMGEKLYLDADLETFAKREQSQAMEHDDREGLVCAYLDRLLPAKWDEMDVYQRRDYLNSDDDPTQPIGESVRREVSNMEIWCECFGKRKEDMTPADSYRIAAIMARLKDWEKSNQRKELKIYGQQRIYIRR